MNHLENYALRYPQTIRFYSGIYLVVYNQIIQRHTNKRIIINHYLRTIIDITLLKNAPSVHYLIFLKPYELTLMP